MDEIEAIPYFRSQFKLDDFELQLLLHYIRIPSETLKRRLHRAPPGMSKFLIETAIKFKEQQKAKKK